MMEEFAKGDDRLYDRRGVAGYDIGEIIDDEIHEYIKKQYREYLDNRIKGDALREEITELISLLDGKMGDLMQPWSHALTDFIQRHSNLSNAAETRLPLTLQLFEGRSGLYGKIGSAAEYRQLLVGAEDPIRALADACEVERETIEALQADAPPFVEVTFLHRIYRHLRDVIGAKRRVHITLECIYAAIDSTHGSWRRAIVYENGEMDMPTCLFRVDIESLTAFYRFIHKYTSHSTTNQQGKVTQLLEALETMWSVRISDTTNEYLQMRVDTLAEVMG